MIDSRDTKELHNALKRAADEFLKRCKDANLNVLITQTYRDAEYQNYLYQKGRTLPGNVVTNARGGESMHNYRLAFDFCKNIKGQEYSDTAFFKACGKIWREMGGTWGGDWTGFVDMPHCEFTNGLTIAQLKKGSKMPDVKMKWEENGSMVGLFQPVTENLKMGSKGDAVKELQVLLNKSGAKLVVDGIFGKATEAAVKAFQKAKNLVVDGIAGIKTFDALRKTSNAEISFVNQIKDYAQELGRQYNILPSFVLGVAVHETGNGKNELTQKANNIFSVKGQYQGQSYTIQAWEERNGEKVIEESAFRKYPSFKESLADFCNLMKNGVSWDKNLYTVVIGQKDIAKLVSDFDKTPYATDSKYGEKLINVINSYKLTQYDPN